MVPEQVDSFGIGETVLEPAGGPCGVIRMVMPLVEVVAQENHPIGIFASDGRFDLVEIGCLVDVSNDEYLFHDPSKLAAVSGETRACPLVHDRSTPSNSPLSGYVYSLFRGNAGRSRSSRASCSSDESPSMDETG
jgi:hypothetical protein